MADKSFVDTPLPQGSTVVTPPAVLAALAANVVAVDVNNQRIINLGQPIIGTTNAATAQYAEGQRSDIPVLLAGLSGAGNWFPAEYVGVGFNITSSPTPGAVGAFIANRAGVLQAFRLLSQTAALAAAVFELYVGAYAVGGPTFVASGVTITLQAGDFETDNLVGTVSVNPGDAVVWLNTSALAHAAGTLTIWGGFRPAAL